MQRKNIKTLNDYILKPNNFQNFNVFFSDTKIIMDYNVLTESRKKYGHT